MIDSVIAGTGNSRYLRTSISASTTWAEALTMLRAGTFPIDLAGINISGFTTLGTALNADTLLKSAVITALGLSENATPSDAWEAVLALIDAKADADSVVTGLSYDGATKTLSATINGVSVTVATFNFTTPQEAAELAPVQSVAGKTGIVALNAGDVAYSEGTSYSANTIGKALEDDDARMGEIEGDISEIQGDISDIQGDITDIQGDITDIQGDISDINGSITGINNELDAFESDVEENYARVDGYYEEMTVGNAEQLVATVGIDDNSPYLFRTTGGSADVGDRKTMELVGGTVAWNQLARRTESQTSETKDGITYTKNDDGSWTIRGLAEATTIKQLAANIGLGTGHKCLIWYGGVTFDSVSFRIGDFNNGTSIVNNAYGAIYNRSGTSVVFDIQIYSGKSVDMTIFPMYFDLTQMFGSTIADYIYSLDQAHVGDGVAWFKKLFPAPYYAYDAGTLMSVKTSANVTIGFNQWDEEWEKGTYDQSTGEKKNNANPNYDHNIRSKNPISIVPNSAYYGLVPYNSTVLGFAIALFYDAGGKYLSYVSLQSRGQLFVTPSNAHYMTFFVSVLYGEIYNHDICFNLSWDGERDGEYESYDAHTYPLDPDLELRGMLKLNENNELYYDGDVYESDGTVTRKYGIVDLGTLNWVYDTAEFSFGYFWVSLDSLNKKWGGAQLITTPYVYVAKPRSQLADKQISNGNMTDSRNVCIRDSAYTDAATFKAAMNGVYLVYELRTPAAESADPFTSPEAVDDFGTEQYVDSRAVPIPVGHNSVYQANLRAKLEMAPDSPDGDGDYLVRQSGGTNAYVPYIFPTAGQVGFDASAEYDDGTVGAELNNKADVDGYYETLTSGLAENLIATVGVDDNAPYIFRTTGGSADVGDRKEMEIVGGTIAWNQLTHDTEASNTKSGDIVTIDDAKAVPFESLKVYFEPQQDLHGYDRPWPAGGGKNKFNLIASNIYRTNGQEGWTYTIENGVLTVVVTAAASNWMRFKVFEITQDMVGKKYVQSCITDPVDNDRWFTQYDPSSNTDSVIYANPVTISQDMVGKWLGVHFKFATVGTYTFSNIQVEEGSSATSYAPYENECPISGWTGVNVWQRGRNLLNVSQANEARKNGAGYFTLEYANNSVTMRCDRVLALNVIWEAFKIKKCHVGKSITISGTVTGGTIYIARTQNKDGDWSQNPITSSSTTRTYTITDDDVGRAIGLEFYNDSGADQTASDLQFELGSSASPYQPYTGQTVPVSWQTEAGTVYGGTYDFVTGDGLATVRKIVITSADSLYSYAQNSSGYYRARYYNYGNWFKNHSEGLYSVGLVTTASNSYNYASPNRFFTENTSVYVMPPSGITTEQTYKDWLDSIGGVEATVELKEPIPFHVDPQTINALAGENNVWNDIGTTELTYKSANEHHTLTNGHKYLTRINNADSFVAGTGQEVVAQCGRDNVFDLSQMFGNTIANYLNGISASNAVAWFRNLFPKPLYAYDAGSLQSVKTSANKTVGFNAWDEEWELGTISSVTGENQDSSTDIRTKNYIPILPNTRYFNYCGSFDASINMRSRFYDANKNYIGYKNADGNAIYWNNAGASYSLVTPSNAAFMRFALPDTYGTTYKHDICINLSWDGERDGEYEPYIARTYPLDSDLELRGIPKLTADNQLCYDGDTYENDGTVTRKYKAVDLGTLSWAATSLNGAPAFYYNMPSTYKNGTNGSIRIDLMFPARYNHVTADYLYTNKTESGIISYNNGHGLQVRDSRYENATALKTSLNGVYALFALEEPTTEEADPYAEFMIIDDFGTEEFVDAGVTAVPPTRDVAIPVGHNTVYAANLRAKLEMAPDSPDGDGDYIVRQTNGENAYVLLEKELPAAPTANGTYILKVVINNGTATYSWEAQT